MLESDVDYDLTKWNEHKATCIPLVYSDFALKKHHLIDHAE